MDLTIEGKAFINGSFQHCCIGIENGRIISIKKNLKADTHHTYTNKLILPAGIDIHVHFRDPGYSYKEDFKTGSQAAVFGGISCVFDMPNTNPPTTTKKALIQKIRNAENKSYTDFGLYAGITPHNLEYIRDFSHFCSGFKIFLGNTTNSLNLPSDLLSSAFQKASTINKPVLIHAEEQACLEKNKIIENNLKDHVLSRPSLCEQKAIQQVLEKNSPYSTPVHICHLSSCDGFELLRNKKKNISVGTTPHHLLFDIDSITMRQPFYKVNPPIRSHFDKETLWYAVNNNLIDVIESDHAPHSFDEKNVDFDTAPSGIAGVETMYPVFLAKVKQGQMTMNTLVSLLCERPAQLMNLSKGKIQVGYDADVIVIDYKKTTPIRAEKLHSKCNWTCYEGFPSIFPSVVYIRGKKIIDDCELIEKPGSGKHVLSNSKNSVSI